MSARLTRAARVASAALAVAALAPAARAQNLITDGGFETGTMPGAGRLATLRESSTLGAWTVLSGSVDLVGSTRWQPAGGTRSVDLNGSAPGAISQTVATKAGQRYDLSFFFAANPDGRNAMVKEMAVLWNGVRVGTFSADWTGHTFANMGWTEGSLDNLVATGPTSTLTFQSLTRATPYAGMALDNVSLVVATPEPASIALMGVGLVAVGAAVRRRRSA